MRLSRRRAPPTTAPPPVAPLTPPAHRTAVLTRADAVMLLTMLLWGANIVSAKIAVRALPPLGFGLLRYFLAGSLLLGLLRWREGSIGLRRADLPAVAVVGVVGIGLNQVGFLLSIHLISASLSAIILATTPLLTTTMAALWAREPLSRSAVGALGGPWAGWWWPSWGGRAA